MHRWARLWILGIGVLGACADAPRPDLRRLYSFDSVDSAQSPVIVIPGILGSRLRDAGGREIWPGSAYEVLFGSKDRLALTIDPQTLEPVADGVVADGLFDALLGRDFYGQLLQTLEGSGGYQRTRAGTPVDDARRRYYVFAYDWRQDNVVTARKLDALIRAVLDSFTIWNSRVPTPNTGTPKVSSSSSVFPSQLQSARTESPFRGPHRVPCSWTRSAVPAGVPLHPTPGRAR